LIVLAGALTYANSLSGPMLFDDQSAILDNPQIRHLWPLAGALAPPRASVLANRPIVNLSFAINYAIGGLSVGACGSVFAKTETVTGQVIDLY